jgi:antitoxin VapB
MVERAKIFRNGGSQAVRLPKSLRFPDDQDEVVVRREGNRIVLEAVDEWSREFLDCLGQWSEPIERPDTLSPSDLRDPFVDR